jgi:D-hydroxyproline dehydrogenase subunit beta
MKEDAVVYSPCVARFLADEAQHMGADLFLGRKVLKVSDEGTVLDDGTVLRAGITILANGTDAVSLVPGIPVQPRKGHLLITDRYPGFVHHQLIELGYLKSAHSTETDSVAFNVQPRQTGQVLIGSSRQYGVDNPVVEDHMMAAMLRRAVEYMPGLLNLSAIRSWTGFRAATPDKLPLIGMCPGHERLYLATGHEGLGISTSLATAKLLADLVLHRQSAIPIAPYLPERSYTPHV